jgi:2'-5' RNA ligase
LESTIKRCFVALLPPPDIQAIARYIQREFTEQYNSRAAQKSPPHITLQPPFPWKLSKLPQVEQELANFAAQQNSFLVKLNGFAAFPPRVVYIDVVKTSILLNLQIDLIAHLKTTVGIENQSLQPRTFVPHMTVAFRDLTEPNFELAWQIFQGRSLQLEFLASSLSLLIHNGQQWQEHQTFPFS